jgi:hypothetical protein
MPPFLPINLLTKIITKQLIKPKKAPQPGYCFPKMVVMTLNQKVSYDNNQKCAEQKSPAQFFIFAVTKEIDHFLNDHNPAPIITIRARLKKYSGYIPKVSESIAVIISGTATMGISLISSAGIR